MNITIRENIRKFNEAKEELAKQGIEISEYNLKNKKNVLIRDGKFIGYINIKNNSFELKQIIHIPELDHFSNSWIVTRIKDGSVIGEFYERSNVEKFNPATCRVETAYQYLTRINRTLKENQN